MDYLVIVTIIITASIQSFFGVGVLLFGTPLLTLLNYSFLDCLLILLPISAIINFLQITIDYKKIHFAIYKYVLFFTVPFVVIFLFLVSINTVDITIAMGIFLIFIAIKDSLPIINKLFEKFLNFNKTFYIFMGIVHGLTNLGGSLLTAKVFFTDLNKTQKRVTIAISYMSLAIFQILTILLFEFNYNLYYLIYFLVGIITYVIVNKIAFKKISEDKYNTLFSFFILLSGISLITKEILW